MITHCWKILDIYITPRLECFFISHQMDMITLFQRPGLALQTSDQESVAEPASSEDESGQVSFNPC